MTEDRERLKQQAAEHTLRFIESGMRLGLGTGSTVYFVLRHLGEQIRQGALRDVVGVPTSRGTARLAQEFGIPLTTLEEHPHLDLTIDGADEVDPNLNLIKGMGGALLREKIVATASQRLIIVVDDRKLVSRLGTRSPLPVEVDPFGWRTLLPFLEDLGARAELRRTVHGGPAITDGGHYILDCQFDGIEDPYDLEVTLNNRPGILENGLFLNMADMVVVASSEGVRVLESSDKVRES